MEAFRVRGLAIEGFTTDTRSKHVDNFFSGLLDFVVGRNCDFRTIW
jgi:hypothetical protein